MFVKFSDFQKLQRQAQDLQRTLDSILATQERQNKIIAELLAAVKEKN